MEMDLRFTVQTRIQKPVTEVFDAVYNPKKLTKYFTTGGADGPLDEGKTVMWSFIDSGVKIPPFPVKVKKLVRNKLIQFSWEASEGVYDAKTGRASKPERDSRQDRRGQVAADRSGPSRLIPELRRLDTHEHVSQSLLGIRHQPTKRISLKNF